jgi:hypothetical protein
MNYSESASSARAESSLLSVLGGRLPRDSSLVSRGSASTEQSAASAVPFSTQLRSGAAAGAVAVSVPSIIPSSALGADDAVVPSE